MIHGKLHSSLGHQLRGNEQLHREKKSCIFSYILTEKKVATSTYIHKYNACSNLYLYCLVEDRARAVVLDQGVVHIGGRFTNTGSYAVLVGLKQHQY